MRDCYRDIRSPLKTRLDLFRATHRERTIASRGHDWRYVIGGDGEATLVLLPGGLGVAEPWFDGMLAWERHFRVIAVSYPEISDVRHAVDAVSAILAREGAGRRFLLGTSLGGQIAQACLRERPGGFERVVLGNTGEPNADEGRRLRRRAPLARLLGSRAVFPLIQRAAGRRVAGLLAPSAAAICCRSRGATSTSCGSRISCSHPEAVQDEKVSRG